MASLRAMLTLFLILSIVQLVQSSRQKRHHFDNVGDFVGNLNTGVELVSSAHGLASFIEHIENPAVVGGTYVTNGTVAPFIDYSVEKAKKLRKMP